MFQSISGDKDTSLTPEGIEQAKKISENIIFTDFSIIIKIDVEGHEMNVIEGSLNLIEKFPPLIIIEFWLFGENG